jgi:hypothetical protein
MIEQMYLISKPGHPAVFIVLQQGKYYKTTWEYLGEHLFSVVYEISTEEALEAISLIALPGEGE